MHVSQLTNIKQLCLHPDVVAATSVIDSSRTDTLSSDFEIILPVQTHSVNVAWVEEDIPDEFPNTDALITHRNDIAVGVRTADCVPILLYASDIKAVAAVHAGWKGTLNGIVDNVVDELIAAGASPSRIYVSFGAAICRQCYEVDASLARLFADAGFADFVSADESIDLLTGYPFAESKPHIDLVGVNIARLKAKNILSENIHNPNLCTRHGRQKNSFMFHSYRRQNCTSDRNITFVKIK